MAFVLAARADNVSHPNVEFTRRTTTTTTPPPPQEEAPVGRQLLVAAVRLRRRPHARSSPAPTPLEPPLHVGWRFEDYALLEFPPVIYQNTLYLIDDDGSAKAINKRTGHKLWQHQGRDAGRRLARARHPARASCTCRCSRPHGQSTPGNGRFVALSMKTGQSSGRKPSRPAPSPRRSSAATTVYFGDQGGTVYALNAHHRARQLDLPRQRRGQGRPGAGGRDPLLRRLRGPGLRASTPPTATRSGRSAPTAPTSGSARATSTRPRRWPSAASTWATPTAACTRSPPQTGQLAWATGTGAYVYASAAVADTPGLGPTVYVGSYDGNFYAFNAQSGAIRWRHPAGGKISGLGDDRRQRRLLLRPRHEDDRRPRRAHRPPGVLVPRRRVQPGGRRRHRHDLPERLHDALPAAAEGTVERRASHDALTVSSTRRSQRTRTKSQRRLERPTNPRIQACNEARTERAFGRFLLSLCVYALS